VTPYVLRTGKTFHSLTDGQGLLDKGEIELVGTLSADAIMVPLKADGDTIGVLCVQRYDSDKVYSEQDVQLLTFVAQHIATALTRARAIEETLQRNNELAILNA
jgi:transcriptional regulator with GAF, ATPase, and Fis domain